MEVVAAEHPAQGVGDPGVVPEPGGDQGVVEVAVGGVVLGAAQGEGAVGGLGEAGGVVRVDLVQRPDAVEVAEVPVVVGVRQTGPRPLGERPVGVDPVCGEAVGEGAPAVGVLGVAVGGGAQGVPGGGEVHGRVQGAPARVGGAVLGRVGGDDDQVAVLVGVLEEVLVEQGGFGQGGGGAGVLGAVGLVVVDEGLEQPVGARGPQVKRVLAAEVVGVARLAVGVRGRDHAAGAEDLAGVVPPVGQLPVDQRGVGPGDLGEGGGRGGGGLQVEVGVGGEGAGPGGVPVAGPQAGEARREQAARRQQVVAAGREEAFQQGGAAGPGEQFRARQGAFGGVGGEVEGDAVVGRAVPGQMPGEEAVVRGPVRGAVQQVAQGAALGERVQFAGVAVHPGQQQHPGGALDEDARRYELRAAAGDDGEGDAGVAEVAAGVAGAQGEQGAVGGEDRAVADAEPRRGAGEAGVEGQVEGEVRGGDVLDDHVVGAGDEDSAGPAGAGGRGLAGGEVDGAAVGGVGVLGSVARGPVQTQLEGRVEGAHPAQRAAVGEVLGGAGVPGEQAALEGGEPGGERGRAAVVVAVGADQGVVGDDHPVGVRIAEHQGAVVAVAAQEGVLPAGGGLGLPGAVDGRAAHDVGSGSRSTATP
ncbi:hypothetical protein SVIOM342S_00505 [Streptomyces violaceorubidus]